MQQRIGKQQIPAGWKPHNRVPVVLGSPHHHAALLELFSGRCHAAQAQALRAVGVTPDGLRISVVTCDRDKDWTQW